jgi:hypothetical protein
MKITTILLKVVAFDSATESDLDFAITTAKRRLDAAGFPVETSGRTKTITTP